MASFSARMGRMAPVSLQTPMTETNAVSGRSAACSAESVTRPSRSGGTSVTSQPRCRRSFRVFRVASCSIWVETSCRPR